MRKSKGISLLLSAALLLFLSACGGEEEPTPAPVVTPTASIRPAPEAVAEVRWQSAGDIPDVMRIDVTIPHLREELPGAEEINGQIDLNYSYDLDRTVEAYDPMERGFAYPYRHIWYEVYEFNGVYELCIRGEEYSLIGSGPLLWTTLYCYDYEAGAPVSVEDFLDRVGYSEEDVLAAFYQDVVYPEVDSTEYAYGDLFGCFYIDGDQNIQFTASLYA